MHPRSKHWHLLYYGCPPKFLQMVNQLHENQRGQVRLNSDLSEPFPISNGVRQGCVLAPTLFSIFFTMMLKQATVDLDDDEGVYVRYHLHGSLFNLRRLQAHTRELKQWTFSGRRRPHRQREVGTDVAVASRQKKTLKR